MNDDVTNVTSSDHATGTSPSQNLASGFFRSVNAHSDRPALMVDGQHLTYAELARMSWQIAAVISRCGHEETKLAAVFALRSTTAYAGILGVLAAGLGYVPLNPHFPLARTRSMLESAGCNIVVVGREAFSQLEELLQGVTRQLVLLLPDVCRETELAARFPAHTFHFAEDLSAEDRLAEVGAVSNDDTAYLLFTSGSTGQPKGVPVSHSNVIAYVEYVVDRYEVTSNDRLSQTFDPTFDLSVHDMFVAWAAGACVYCVPDTLISVPARFIRDHELTLWFSVPSTINYMSRLRLLRPGLFPSLRYSLFCGEALPEKSAAAWQEAAPNSIVENLYGPTEATIAITSFRWDSLSTPDRCRNGIVPIGWPFAGQSVCIADEQYRPLPPGESGELLLAGSQVTKGYWQNPEITSQRYVRTSPDNGLLWYRTGDRVVADPDGCLIYLGRFDHQVKIRGFRAELQEIESVLRRAAGTELVAAVAWPVYNGNAEGIVGFVCGAAVSDVPQILGDCRKELPDYMVPQTIHVLEELPLNANGKVDRGQLATFLAGESP